MNKKQKIILIAFGVLFALLVIGALIGTAAMLLFGNPQGLVGELLDDNNMNVERNTQESGYGADTQMPVSSPEELITQDEESSRIKEVFDYTTLFDFEMQHKPTYEDYLKIAENMTVEEAVAILGKPHNMDAAAGSKYLTWEMADGGSCWIRAVSLRATESPTEWSEILRPNYGGAIVAYHYCYGYDVDDGK
jgi:hypothetical protein